MIIGGVRTDFERSARYKLINTLLAEKAQSSAVGQIGLISIVAIAMSEGNLGPLNLTIVGAIIGSIVSLNLLRIWMGRLQRIKPAFGSTAVWHGTYAFLTVLSSALWSSLCISILGQFGLSSEASVLTLIINAGIAAAATASLSPDVRLARAFVVFGLLPISGALAFLLPQEHYYLAAVLVLYMAFLFVQIGIQARTLLRLHDREAQVRALVDASMEAIIVQKGGEIIEVNPAFEQLFEIKAEDAIGKEVLDFTPPEDRAENLKTMEEEPIRRQIRGLKNDGTVFPIEVYGKWFYYKGETARVTCVQDISHRLLAEERIRESARQIELLAQEREKAAFESVKLKSEFLANMSHEIRTPLNAIIGFADLLEEESSQDLRKRYLKTLKTSSESLLNLVNEILDFSKIDAGRLELESVDFSIITLVESQTELVGSRARQKGLSLSTFVDPSLPVKVRGDFARIGQVLLNLLSNAIKFTEEGTISVTCKAVGIDDQRLTVRFEVQDSGIGISDEQAVRLFVPFSQADSSTSRKHGGTGLGLSICRKVLEKMGGVISFESRVGQGTKFWFEVPLEITDPNSHLKTYKSKVDSVSQITLLSSSPEAGENLSSYIRSWELAVATEPRCFSRVRKFEPDAGVEIVIVDPSRTPSETMQRLAAARERGDIRILGIDESGGGTQGEQQDWRRFMDRVLHAPVRQSDLYDAIVDLAASYKKSVNQGDSGASSSESKNETKQVMFQSARILVVEDNSTNQMLILALLRRFGLQCQAVVNGLEALSALEQGGYDLVLMDCQMPEMDGFEATMEIRKREQMEGGHIPIIALTANVLESDRDRCIECGMDGFVSKPIRRDKLVEALKPFLKTKEAAA